MISMLLWVPRSYADTEHSPLISLDAGASVELRARQDVAWPSVAHVRVLPTRFALDPEVHRRRYDSRARRTLDSTLSAGDREHLGASLCSALRRTVCDATLAKDDAKVEDGTLLLEPVVVQALWTRPPGRAYAVNSYLDSRSVRAGGAMVRTNAFLVKEGRRQPVAVVVDRWQARLGDGLVRVTIWGDADRAFRIVGQRLARHLRRLGLDCE